MPNLRTPALFSLLVAACLMSSCGSSEQETDPSDSPSGGSTGTGNTTPTPLPSGEIKVDGRHLRVGGESIQIRGVCWNPVRKGEVQPGGLDFAGAAPGDIPLMAAAGFNAVRTYEPITDRAVLDQLHAAGIWALMSVYTLGSEPPESAATPVDAVKDHPAVLLWLIGNEWNYNGLYAGKSIVESVGLLNQAAAAIRRQDTAHPIATIHGALPSAEIVEAMPDVDVWGLNVYSGIGFGDLFSQWANLSRKPMFLAEYGADAYNANLPGYDPRSQVEATRSLTQEILGTTVALHDRGVTLGGTIFEWNDEWWKDEQGSPDVQDTGGIAPGGGPHPDRTFNEEWWGIVDIDRKTRPAYDALKALYTGQ
jgi:Glycosyl hydrolases family 2, TIM barrel domain